jgi:hypothetical protein
MFRSGQRSLNYLDALAAGDTAGVVEGVGDGVAAGVLAAPAGAEAPGDAEGVDVAIRSTTKISSSFGLIDP